MLIPSGSFTSTVSKEKWWTNCLDYPGFSSEIELRLVTAAVDSILRLDTSCGCVESQRLDTSYHWVEFRQLDSSYGWLHSTADSSSGSWIWLKADSILQLTTSCGWFYSAADSSPTAGLDLRLTSTLIYQGNLRTYSAKRIIFMVCFLPTDFSYHWSRLWLLFQKPWRSLRKLEEAWRSLLRLILVAAADSSCDGWF